MLALVFDVFERDFAFVACVGKEDATWQSGTQRQQHGCRRALSP